MHAIAAGTALATAGGTTKGKIGFHGGRVEVRRPRVRSDGQEITLPSWKAAQAEDWLGRWAMNLMLINVSTRKLKRAVRLPEGDLPTVMGDGASKSAASRRFVPLGLIEGATENAAVVQALIDNLIERGLDPKVCRLFIVDGAKALTKVIRSSFGRHTPIQRSACLALVEILKPRICSA